MQYSRSCNVRRRSALAENNKRTIGRAYRRWVDQIVILTLPDRFRTPRHAGLNTDAHLRFPSVPTKKVVHGKSLFILTGDAKGVHTEHGTSRPSSDGNFPFVPAQLLFPSVRVKGHNFPRVLIPFITFPWKKHRRMIHQYNGFVFPFSFKCYILSMVYFFFYD